MTRKNVWHAIKHHVLPLVISAAEASNSNFHQQFLDIVEQNFDADLFIDEYNRAVLQEHTSLDWFIMRKALSSTLLKLEIQKPKYKQQLTEYFYSYMCKQLGCGDIHVDKDMVLQLMRSNSKLVLSDDMLNTCKKFKYTAIVTNLLNLYLNIASLKNGLVTEIFDYFSNATAEVKYNFVFKVTWFMAFNISVDILSTFPVLDAKTWTMGVDDFKRSISGIKQMSEMSNVPCLFIGVEQCCGIQKYISAEDKLKYVREWLLIDKDGRRSADRVLLRTILKALFQKKAGYDWQKNLKKICDNPELELASGSLQLAKNMSVAHDNRKKIKNLGYNIVSKKGLGLLISPDDLKECVMDEHLTHDIIVSSASDYNKVRFIASADVISFIRQKLLYDGLEYKIKSPNLTELPIVIGKYRFFISIASFNDQAVNYVNNCAPQSKVGPFMLPLDFSTFDFNPNRKEINMFLEELGDLVDAQVIAKLLIYGDMNGSVIVDGVKVGHHKSGLPSGWLLTSLFGSIMNLYWNLLVILNHDCVTIDNRPPVFYINVLGDDVDMSSNLTLDSYRELVSLYSSKFNLTLHPDKMSYRAVRSEFLRTTTVMPTQYLARAIHSIIQRNEKNAVAIYESLQGTRSMISEVLNKYNNLILRNGLTFNDGIKWMMLIELEEIRRGLKDTRKDAFYAFLRLPRFDGGCGCALNLADIDFRRRYSVTIKTPVLDIKKYMDMNVIGLDPYRFDTILKFGAVENAKGMKYSMIWKDKQLSICENNIKNYYNQGYAQFVENTIFTSQVGLLAINNIVTGIDVAFWNSRVRELLASGLNEKEIVDKLRRFGMSRSTAKMIAKSDISQGDVVSFVVNGIIGNACSSILMRLTVGSVTLMRQMTAWLYNLNPMTGVALALNY